MKTIICNKIMIVTSGSSIYSNKEFNGIGLIKNMSNTKGIVISFPNIGLDLLQIPKGDIYVIPDNSLGNNQLCALADGRYNVCEEK